MLGIINDWNTNLKELNNKHRFDENFLLQKVKDIKYTTDDFKKQIEEYSNYVIINKEEFKNKMNLMKNSFKILNLVNIKHLIRMNL
jgi:hypothetical protein